MALLSIEHSRAAYRADFALYAGAVAVLAACLLSRTGGPAQWLQLAACTLGGLAGWTAIEYGLHRFVLHGLQPFARWHVLHHQRPTALICAPTLLSGGLIGGLIFLPAWLVSDLWHAVALTLGVLIGYLAYALTHHATHHWRPKGAWLKRRKQWHARHHRHGAPATCYGVTSAFWDRVCRSA
jgi:sterol desaturase/sphingolipid hydroxylase (fatty acid hydroxylase superfamily)